MRRRRAISILGLMTLLVANAAGQDGPVSFVNTVAVGDSLTAGAKSGVLKEDGQVNSYVSLLVQQIGTFFFQPLIPEPGFGSEIRLEDGELITDPPTISERTFPLVVVQNLAIPGHDALEALTVRPDLPLDTLEDIILGLPILVVPLGIPPASQIELAVGLQPTFTIVWLGSNDVLRAAIAGEVPTPLPVFQEAYATAIGALVTLTHTRLVVANVPAVTNIPFLTSAEEIASQLGLPLPVIGLLLGLNEGDFVRLPGIPLIEPILTGQVPGPLPAEVILRADEVAQLELLIAQMNGFISAIGLQFGFPVVDIHTAFNDIHQNGIEVGDRRLTTDFFGGIFSLDGIHPTNTGQAITANAFIDTINAFYNLAIPPVDVARVAADDPLIFAEAGPAARPPLLRAFSRGVPPDLLAILDLDLTIHPNPAGRLDPGEDPRIGSGLELQEEIERGLEFFSRLSLSPGPVSVRQDWEGYRKRVPVEKQGKQPLATPPFRN